MTVFCALLAALSVWEYPARQPQHQELRSQLAAALRDGDGAAMVAAAEAGTELLPDDPTWRYNLACAYAREGRRNEALRALALAVELGWRRPHAIEVDPDLAALAALPEFKAVVARARALEGEPVMTGPLATTTAFAFAGEPVTLGERNLGWDLEAGLFSAKLELVTNGVARANDFDLYVNRDGGHSKLKTADFPGVTPVTFDAEARRRRVHLGSPNTLYPYPVFGNCSEAFLDGPYWRSFPRALMTTLSPSLAAMGRLYLANQIWVYPANDDFAPAGTNGDIFASVTPYWLTTAGRSWSDQYYLRAALKASGAFRPEVKREIVRRRLLAPTVQALIRRSLKTVTNEADYLSAKAHPTALPPHGLDLRRLVQAAAALKVEEIAPVAVLAGVGGKVADQPALPELTYATPCAIAFVLRSADTNRLFSVRASGGAEYAFAIVHDERGAAEIVAQDGNVVHLRLDRTRMSVTNRVDLAVFARSATSGWGAPSYVSFAVTEPGGAAYSDPFLK